MKDIKEFEEIHKVKCTMRPDGMYDVDGSIFISYTYLTSIIDAIPPIHTLNGHFSCAYNNLVDLKGCPLNIHGNFSCYCNHIHNMNHTPIVKGHSNYDNNVLIF